MAAKKKILLVEDQDDARAFMRVLVEGAGWEAQEAASSAAALESARRDKPDAVVMDIMMPGGSGFQCILEMRAVEALKAVPILVCTARFNDKDEEQCRALGADDFITKPFKNEDLCGKLRKLLEKSAGPRKS
ncbi:MAG TPA: response regulator [Elusimicrobiota bacterium]|jgi:DNA-binding response OmpR family regulator|nr:response regulator [Elusimicrobiota bacterium]